MIRDSVIMLWLVKCLYVDRFAVLLTVSRSFNITHLQFGEHFSKHGFPAINKNFFARLIAYPSATRRGKMCLSRYWIPDSYRLRDFGFLELNFGFESPRYQIPLAKICQIPESALSYIRRDKNIDYWFSTVFIRISAQPRISAHLK